MALPRKFLVLVLALEQPGDRTERNIERGQIEYENDLFADRGVTSVERYAAAGLGAMLHELSMRSLPSTVRALPEREWPRFTSKRTDAR